MSLKISMQICTDQNIEDDRQYAIYWPIQTGTVCILLEWVDLVLKFQAKKIEPYHVGNLFVFQYADFKNIKISSLEVQNEHQ